MGHIHSLRVRHAGHEVLRLEGVEVPDRGILAVMGKGGSGKSTLLRALAGRFFGAAGWEMELDMAGVPSPATFVPQRSRSGGRCEESFGPPPCGRTLPPDCRLEPLRTGRRSSQTCGHAWNSLLLEALEAPGPLLLLDEPEGGVPAYSLDYLADALRAIQAKSTIVVVTHHLPFARRVADAALFLEEGRCLLQADRDRFFSGAGQPRVREFLKWGG